MAWIRELATQWRQLLAGLSADELARMSSLPWDATARRTVTHTALWVNTELTKNMAEIGQLRILRAAHL